MPKFGAGSEFGREEREEARRKKYGIHRRKYAIEDQPWLMKVGSGKNARKYDTISFVVGIKNAYKTLTIELRFTIQVQRNERGWYSGEYVLLHLHAESGRSVQCDPGARVAQLHSCDQVQAFKHRRS